MKLTTDPLVIVAYGAYTRDAREGGGAMMRADGTAVEYVEITDADSASVDAGARRFTLDPSINGGRPEVGATVRLVVSDWQEPEARVSQRTGRAYIGRKRKSLVTGFLPK